MHPNVLVFKNEVKSASVLMTAWEGEKSEHGVFWQVIETLWN